MRKKPTQLSSRRKKTREPDEPTVLVPVERYGPENHAATAAWNALWDMLLDWMAEPDEEQAA